MAVLLPNKRKESIKEGFRQALETRYVKTLTLDNGSESVDFKDIEAMLNTEVYFADPHSPWQRGNNENINGVIRFFFPKGTDFTAIS